MAGPRPIKDTLQGLMQALTEKNKSSLKESPWGLLKEILSEKEAGRARPNYFKNGVLSIGVDSAGWLYHLSLRKEDLLRKLRERSPVLIKEIRFYLRDKE